ncbi:MAG TPA: FtsX-like permease family protein [Gaiellaceae bacterium]|nr:FtsX-like permease family protein [Gaiellaceae bacterium]
METAAAAGRSGRREQAVWEQLLVPVRYGLLRLRSQAPRSLLVALGVAVGAAVLALTSVGSVAVQDRAVQRALAELAPSDRAVQAVWSGVPAQSTLSYAQLDALAQRSVTPILGQRPFAVAVFRQATWGGAFVNLGAVDGLAKWLDLRAGRLPRTCTPSDCELVQIGGAPASPKLPFLHVVGRARFRPGAPLGSYFGAEGGRRPPILLARGVRPFLRTPLPDAPLIARTYGWIVPVAPRSIHDWQLGGLDTRLTRAQQQLERRSDIFTVAAPTTTLQDIRATSRVGAERLLILGGDAAVLLLGFAVLAATRLRRDHRAMRDRLTWSGARRLQILLVSLTEVVGVTVVATLAGWVAGTAAGGALARHLGAPGSLVVAHTVLSWRTVALAVALAAITTVAMLAVLRGDGLDVGGLRVTVADAAALGALAAVLLALARGKADASSLASSGTGVMLLLLPGLVLFVLAVAVARLVGPALRGLEWVSRRAAPPLRVALLSLARSPGDVALTVVFFVLSVGIAVFAFAYRATLVDGLREQARYAVPAPYVASEDLGKLVTIQQAGLTQGDQVVRESGSVRDADLTLVGLTPRALARVDGWRGDFSRRSPAELAALLRPTEKAGLHGVRLHGATLALPLTLTGDRVGVAAVIRNPRGDFTQLLLGEHDAGTYVLHRRLPPEARGGKVVALRLSFPAIAAYVAGHKEAETTQSVSDASRGTIRLDSRFAGWFGTSGVRVDGSVLHFVVNNAGDAIVRPHQPFEGSLVPVVVSPRVARAAGPDGVVALRVENSVVPAKVVATTRYFPSVDGDVALADRDTWLTVANTLDPGSATASEAWLDAPPPRALPLAVASQHAEEQRLSGDPLARGSIALLVLTALVALVLAAVGVVLTVVGDVRDDRAALADLAAQGARPRELRRHVLLRAGVVGGLGTAAGVAAGAIVSALVVAVVTVTAGAQTALPPLALAFDWPLLLAALAAVALVSALAARRIA